MSGMRKLGRSKAKAALALINPANAVLPADAETRISALEAIDHWHTNLTQLDKVRGYSGFTFFGDGRGLSFIVKTSDYTILTTDSGIICDSTSGNIVLTLPNPTLCFDSTNFASIIYDIHKVDSSVNTVTILPYASETIAGESKIVLTRKNENVEIATDGTDWLVRNRDRIYEGQKQTFKPSSVVIADTTVANTTVETELFSMSFFADELRARDIVETVINGYYSTTNASDTFIVRVKINGTTVHSFNSVAKNVTNAPVEMRHKFTVRGSGTSAAISGMAIFKAYNDSLFGSDVQDGIMNLTIANTITITMQWDSAAVGNTGTLKQGICKING